MSSSGHIWSSQFQSANSPLTVVGLRNFIFSTHANLINTVVNTFDFYYYYYYYFQCLVCFSFIYEIVKLKVYKENNDFLVYVY